MSALKMISAMGSVSVLIPQGLNRVCAVAVVVASGSVALADDSILFNRDVRPILSDKCFQCHGPDEQSREAGLRLDIGTGDEAAVAQGAIVAGDLAASELWTRINSADAEQLMPPKDSHKKPLTAHQKSVLRRWIEQGAAYEQFWAFVPAQVAEVPESKDPVWAGSVIDRFVIDRLAAEEIEPSPMADKRTLIRRLTFDLTGLPPTVAEIQEFLSDPSDDAYPRLVERLLQSRRYGEHMAKYWLDLVRFADTNGIHHDHYREMTPYRDWVIRSFNANLPFDQFATYQLAGDLYENPTNDQLIASGFNRLHLVIDRGTALPQESFTRNVVDRVNAVGTAFMGLTVGCAVCHDHKYDPITQRDFYRLYAFFNNIDAPPETPGRGIHEPALRLPTQEQSVQLKRMELEIAEAKKNVQALKADSKNAAEVSVQETGDGSGVNSGANIEAKTSELQRAEDKLKQLQNRQKKLQASVAVTLVMKERSEVRPTHILVRGAYDQPGELVQRGTPDFLPPLKSEHETLSRMDLARWLTSEEHPLTARVTVNRFWQQFFGVGLVRTSEDFGAQGEQPSHPDLLDALAIEFVRSGWDVKRLVRELVNSATYRQSSQADESDYERDSQNRLLARGSRFRLDAEMVRDQILFTSGLMNHKMYGQSVKPPQPPNLWKNVSMVSSSTYAFEADEGADIYRRSVYTFWKRALPPPQMTIFDAPTRESCIARRERTNTPLQALVLMNEGVYFSAARKFAIDLVNDHTAPRMRVERAYEAITSQLPDDDELGWMLENVSALHENYKDNPAAANELTQDIEELTTVQRAEIAAYTLLVNALFNLDATKTRQ